MDPQDRPNRMTGIACAACGVDVSTDTVRVLAERDDLAFVEVSCGSCGSLSLAMVVEQSADDPEPIDILARAFDAPTVLDHEDVLAVRSFLSAYRGDLRGLVGAGRPDERESAGPA
jgi:hypothetical protein